ncbi:glycerate kinase [Intrasporangium mesophilum]
MPTRQVVVALDSFKGSISARDAVAALSAGITAVTTGATVVQLPIADGGEGTVDALLAAGFSSRSHTVVGPLLTPVQATVGVRGNEAVVELASAAGLHLLPGPPTPETALRATTFGVGQLVSAVVGAGATRVVIGLGGSCTTDGGSGLVQALGVELLAHDGHRLGPDGGGTLSDLDRLVPPPGWPLRGVQFVAATDVTNPLLGPDGAAGVFGPQKGAAPRDVGLLEAGLTRWADAVDRTTGTDCRDRPGVGAAGGTGFALAALLGAELTSGIDLVLDLAGFDEIVDRDTLVVVGEGSLDRQTLQGKGPFGVARRAVRAGAQVIAVAGRCRLDAADLARAGIRAVHTLEDLEPNVARSMANASTLLFETGRALGLAHP